MFIVFNIFTNKNQLIYSPSIRISLLYSFNLLNFLLYKMASFHSYTLSISYFLIFSILFIPSHGAFVEEISDILTIKRSEKTSHLHFYFHDIVSGKNPSSIKVISPGGDGIYGFGKTFIFDDALTVGPNASSKVIGIAQGIYSIASQSELALLMVLTFEFIEGKYDGSSISILGRNSVPRDVREMPIVGGTGLFRFARGYALAHTFKFDINSGDATVEYNVFVQHY
ncbi:PREDICTED: dirigent protein 22-like [Nicotiana attenuata]|uniref:dirigent protein 22-like n=1 Tax=Nicotiana attenuata TaxID=49451 RepID=UPI0009047772|nr:PREDICTED: dirigent protein 22-like [Nicotiana attenuata]